jgi:hypothetical protein
LFMKHTYEFCGSSFMTEATVGFTETVNVYINCKVDPATLRNGEKIRCVNNLSRSFSGVIESLATPAD